jgi:hypothetical protein
LIQVQFAWERLKIRVVKLGLTQLNILLILDMFHGLLVNETAVNGLYVHPLFIMLRFNRIQATMNKNKHSESHLTLFYSSRKILLIVHKRFLTIQTIYAWEKTAQSTLHNYWGISVLFWLGENVKKSFTSKEWSSRGESYPIEASHFKDYPLLAHK